MLQEAIEDAGVERGSVTRVSRSRAPISGPKLVRHATTRDTAAFWQFGLLILPSRSERVKCSLQTNSVKIPVSFM